MKKTLMAGVIASLLPAAAMAQPADPNCVASNNGSRVEGTVLGAGAGALLGSVLAGRHSRGEGAVLGAIGGGIGGNVIAGQRNSPCPPGYYYGPNGPPPPPQAGYQNGYGPPPPANGGYYQQGYAPPQQGNFWYGAPTDVRQRIDWMRQRIDRMSADGRLSPDESARAHRDLRSISYYARSNSQQQGYLSPDQQNYVQDRLNHLRDTLHWMAQTGY